MQSWPHRSVLVDLYSILYLDPSFSLTICVAFLTQMVSVLLIVKHPPTPVLLLPQFLSFFLTTEMFTIILNGYFHLGRISFRANCKAQKYPTKFQKPRDMTKDALTSRTICDRLCSPPSMHRRSVRLCLCGCVCVRHHDCDFTDSSHCD